MDIDLSDSNVKRRPRDAEKRLFLKMLDDDDVKEKIKKIKM